MGQEESQLCTIILRRVTEDGEKIASLTYYTAAGDQVSRTIKNSWIVPYSPKLSIMFQYHLIVQHSLCRVGGIKYLFEHVCKENHRVPVQTVRGHKTYDRHAKRDYDRHVSASEALWKLFQVKLIDKNIFIVRLDAHLKIHYTVYFWEGQKEPKTLRARLGTKKTERFAVNFKSPDAAHTHSADFPFSFT